MGKSAPSPPAAPDPAGTAKAQGAINKETAIVQAQLNRPNQYTPQGSSTWTKSGGGFDQASWEADMNRWNSGPEHGGLTSDPTLRKADYQITPDWTQNVTYSPEQQRLYNLQTQGQERLGVTANEQLGRLQSSLNKPLNYDGLPDVGEYGADRQRTEDALYGRINPQLESDRAALERNFREKFEALNRVNLSDAEFKRLLDDIVTADVFTAARTLRELNAFTHDDGTPLKTHWSTSKTGAV
jgi:hypothetical protein